MIPILIQKNNLHVVIETWNILEILLNLKNYEKNNDLHTKTDAIKINPTLF